MCSSNGFPSLATVADRFLERPRNRDWRFLLSDLDMEVPSLLIVVLLERLLIRKKFLSFGKWPVPLACLLDDIERPEKFRFSEGTVVALLEDPKSCVILSYHGELLGYRNSYGCRCPLSTGLAPSTRFHVVQNEGLLAGRLLNEIFGEYPRNADQCIRGVIAAIIGEERCVVVVASFCAPFRPEIGDEGW